MSDLSYVAVVLDQGVKKALDYAIPAQFQGQVEVGMRVEVPLRNQVVKATVVALKKSPSFPNPKSMIRLLAQGGSLSDSLFQLAEWMATYYATPLQKVMKCFVPPNVRKETKEKKEFLFVLAQSMEKTTEQIIKLRSHNPTHGVILEKILSSPKGVKSSDLMEELGISRSPIQTLMKQKWIAKKESVPLELEEEEFFRSKPKTLNQEQSDCLNEIYSSLEKGLFAAHLIQGVTGSGKTEVYLQAIAKTLEMGKSAILLVPEVALTSQTIERFRARFQEKIAIWHHRRSLGQRTTAWDSLKSGAAQIVIGARSAIFCPAQNVGLIIVDEEHDSSYKQSDEQPCYNGRDLAVKRAHIEKAVVLLGSATPSIESRYNADNGKYKLNKLLSRATKAQMPKVQIVDMGQAFERNGGFTHFSQELIEALKLRIEAGEQSLLFLNRRGYHRLQICASCQYTIKCPHCDLGLTFHKSDHELRCHLCDFKQAPPLSCPQCQSKQTLEFKGFGTEHVERSLHALLPNVRTLRMDRDTTKQKESHEEIYKQFRAHKADVLIGTQMIAKGFHFPAATLVGVLNTDATLNIPDFRSSEQVFQLITQVAGRAGRSELPGEVILQTFLPHHPIIQLAASQDYESFYIRELSERRLFSYPPFCHLIKITCFGPDPIETEKNAHLLHAAIKSALPPHTELLPPLPSGHAKIKDNYRFQFLIKTAKISFLSPLLATLSPSINYKIDIDPISTFF